MRTGSFAFFCVSDVGAEVPPVPSFFDEEAGCAANPFAETGAVFLPSFVALPLAFTAGDPLPLDGEAKEADLGLEGCPEAAAEAVEADLPLDGAERADAPFAFLAVVLLVKSASDALLRFGSVGLVIVGACAGSDVWGIVRSIGATC